jgi:hypothetical protein
MTYTFTKKKKKAEMMNRAFSTHNDQGISETQASVVLSSSTGEGEADRSSLAGEEESDRSSLVGEEESDRSTLVGEELDLYRPRQSGKWL